MNSRLLKDAILRIGEVSEINGRTVIILVDRNKNVSDLLFDGSIIKNTSVGGYIEIRKGFLSIIGKVEGEKLVESKEYGKFENDYQLRDINRRYLSVKLCGYINSDDRFIGGIKELPLLASEAYLLTDYKVHLIHNLLKTNTKLKISIARTDVEEIPIDFPVDDLFNSHIAIFGNTGSGKSNTLAALYHGLMEKLKTKKNFRNCYFFFFDFNSEYINQYCVSDKKKVYNLSNSKKESDKIPIKFDELMDIDNISILFEASEKTQKPFLRRTLRYYKKVTSSKTENGQSDFFAYFVNIIKHDVKKLLLMSNKDTAYKIIEYINDILAYFTDMENVQYNIGFHDTNKYFHLLDGRDAYLTNFQEHQEHINDTYFFKIIDRIMPEQLTDISYFNMFYIFILLQFIHDLQIFQVQTEHILPFITRYRSKKKNIEDVFVIDETKNIWDDSNIVVINMHDLNIDMKKTVPLLLAKCIGNPPALPGRLEKAVPCPAWYG
jgi:hypothetical protein